MQNGIFVLTAQVCGMGWLATNLVTLSRWTHRDDGLDIILLNQSGVPTSQCIFYSVSGSVTRPSKIEPNYIHCVNVLNERRRKKKEKNASHHFAKSPQWQISKKLNKKKTFVR